MSVNVNEDVDLSDLDQLTEDVTHALCQFCYPEEEDDKRLNQPFLIAVCGETFPRVAFPESSPSGFLPPPNACVACLVRAMVGGCATCGRLP
jgi:hypothetical protein